MTTNITPLPPAPSRADPTNFRTRADAFMAALVTLSTEINAWALTNPQPAFAMGGAITNPSNYAANFGSGALTAGTLSATSTLIVGNAVTTTGAMFGVDTGGVIAVSSSSGDAVIRGAIGIGTTNRILFAQGSSGNIYGMFDGSGNLLVGAGSAFASGVVQFKRASGTDEVQNLWSAAAAGDNCFLYLGTDGTFTGRGGIDYNRAGGQVRYNTTSDATLKTLIGDAPREVSCDILRSTRLREYYWNDDPSQRPQISPFAQELYETFRGAVSVGGDYTTTDEDGNEITQYRPWGVDKTAFSFHLVAGWQDHESRLCAVELFGDLLADHETRIVSLEAAVLH